MKKVYDLETRKRIVSGYEQSGMSQRSWCKANGVSTASFSRWKRSFSKQEKSFEPQKQDVVCLNPALKISQKVWHSYISQKSKDENKSCDFVPTISVESKGVVIRLNNDADPNLAIALLQLIGAML